MTAKLARLQGSLQKKQDNFDKRFECQKQEVIANQCEPLAGNRKGNATLRRWEKQNNALRTLSQGIEKTVAAIEREQNAIERVQDALVTIPAPIIELIENGTLTQWRKFPHFFFVNGVEKARIMWDKKDGKVGHKHLSSITEPDQRKKFAQVFNVLAQKLNK